MKKIILIMLLAIGLNAQVYDLLGTAQRIKNTQFHPSWVSFDGVDDYYSVADNDNLDFGDGDFSVSVDFVGYKSDDYDYFFSKEENNDNRTRFLISNLENRLYYIATTGGVDVIHAYCSFNYSNGVKYNITFSVKRDDEVIFYVNSVPQTTTTTVNNVSDISNSAEMDIGWRTASVNSKIDIYGLKLYNRALTADEVWDMYNYGHPELYSLPYADRGASNTDLLSGWDFTDGWTTSNATIIDSNSFSTAAVGGIIGGAVGETGYRYLLKIVGETAGGSTIDVRNATSGLTILDDLESPFDTTIEFIWDDRVNPDPRFYIRNSASDTTTITTFEITKLGAVAEYYPENATSYSWIDASTNNSHAQGSGSPNAVRNPLLKDLEQFKGSVAANTNTTLTSIIPAGYRLEAVSAYSDSALTAIKIGTASAGEQIVASTTTTAGDEKILTLAAGAVDAAYNRDSAVTLYARHDTGASGKTMNLIFYCRKVGR